jgi:hypothetical protein
VGAKRRVKLLNVRLGPEETAMAAELREEGVEMSSLVRDAIRNEYGRRRRRLRPQDVDALLAEIYARHPDPPGPTKPRPDIHDRRAFREAFRRRVRAEPER